MGADCCRSDRWFQFDPTGALALTGRCPLSARSGHRTKIAALQGRDLRERHIDIEVVYQHAPPNNLMLDQAFFAYRRFVWEISEAVVA